MREIPLTQGFVALVDDADYEELVKFKWHVQNKNGATYARRSTKGSNMFMHRQIINAPPRSIVDHIDGNPLNNQKNNLRILSARDNSYRRHRLPTNTSGFRGVTRRKGRNRFRAEICHEGKHYCWGSFLSAEEAAKAYDRAAVELFGPVIAMLNFPEDYAKDKIIDELRLKIANLESVIEAYRCGEHLNPKSK